MFFAPAIHIDVGQWSRGGIYEDLPSFFGKFWKVVDGSPRHVVMRPICSVLSAGLPGIVGRRIGQYAWVGWSTAPTFPRPLPAVRVACRHPRLVRIEAFLAQNLPDVAGDLCELIAITAEFRNFGARLRPLSIRASERSDGLRDFQMHMRQLRHGVLNTRQARHWRGPSACQRGLAQKSVRLRATLKSITR